MDFDFINFPTGVEPPSISGSRSGADGGAMPVAGLVSAAVPPVRDAGSDPVVAGACRLAWMANWLRAATRTPTHLTEAEQELLSGALLLAFHRLEFSPRLGWKVAELLDLLAAETAAQGMRGQS